MAIGIDIGGSKILLVRTENSKILDRRIYKTEPGNVVNLLRSIIDINSTEKIGVAVPGYVVGRVCISAPHVPDLEKFDFSKEFPNVKVINDATAMAYGEYLLRNERHRCLLLIVLGTGVGCGLILDGKPFVGRGSGLELGHLKGYSTIKCSCGKIGCFETIAGGAYLKDIERMTERAKARDSTALEFFRRYGIRLASGIAHVIQLLDPEIVVFGGGIGQHFELFKEGLLEELDKLLTFISPSDIIFERCISYDSGGIGAAAIAERDVI